ncbi:HAMP domain-containing protein [Rhizobium mongolense]|uniref:Two-component system sensor histidine kinase AdeS n=1 Tax=Rhizobium mongolense TaxID=57676 RepID=A0A7W6RHL7_9HYPH|nr:HAMP domain-containing protein [Rhizobium mongolense]MBB4272605.1 two-component system sensor histidine kinase AdeS [Rhizobium mongolense]
MGNPATAYVGLRVEKRLVTPLVTVTEAVRSIASGDLGGRASGQGSFGEADHLIEYFNRMAE